RRPAQRRRRAGVGPGDPERASEGLHAPRGDPVGEAVEEGRVPGLERDRGQEGVAPGRGAAGALRVETERPGHVRVEAGAGVAGEVPGSLGLWRGSEIGASEVVAAADERTWGEQSGHRVAPLRVLVTVP